MIKKLPTKAELAAGQENSSVERQASPFQAINKRVRPRVVELKRERPMHLMFVSVAFPFPATNGITMRSLSLLKALAKLGHQVHLVTFSGRSDVDAPEILEMCRTVRQIEQSFDSLSGRGQLPRRLQLLPHPRPYGVLRYRSSRMKRTICDLLESQPIDAVICDLDSLINLPKGLPVPLVMNSADLEHLILKRYLRYEHNPARWLYTWLESEKIKAWERSAWSRAKLVLACSGHDQSLIRQICFASSVTVVPNVVDPEAYVASTDEDAVRVLYTGGMDWYPNRDAVEFFTFSILPLLRKLVPKVRFVVAGRSPADEFRRRFVGVSDVEFTGTVEDMHAEISKAAVCVVPLRIGSGTRLKILEAAAMSKAIVSTRMGAEGLEFANDAEILLADEPKAFARAVADLLENAPRRHEIGIAARRRVQAQYSSATLELALRRALTVLNGGMHSLTLEGFTAPAGLVQP